MAVCIYTQRKS